MKILFYGDSNTYGYDPRGPIPGRYDFDRTWVGIVKASLGNSYEIIADGMNGREIPHTEHAIQGFTDVLKRHQPLSHLGIMLGSNDYLNSWKPDVPFVINRMKTLIGKVKKEYPYIQILLIAPPQIRTAGDPYMKDYDTCNGVLSKAFQSLSVDENTLFLDIGTDDIDLAYDGVHLSEKGHRQMAKKVIDYLKSNVNNDYEL